MGEVGLEVDLNGMRALSPLELYPYSESVSLFSPDPTMQDDMLLEKSAGKHLQQLSPSNDLGSEHSEDLSSLSKSKSGDSSPLTVPEKKGSSPSPATSPPVLHTQPQYQNYDFSPQDTLGYPGRSNNAASSSVPAANLWSGQTSEDPMMQSMPTMNGGLQMQNIPLTSSFFNPSLAPPMSLQQAQRRSLPPQPSPSSQQTFLTTQLQAQAQAQIQANNLLLQGNKHLSWNGSQPQGWNSQQQGLGSNPWGSVGSPPATFPNQNRRSMPPLSTNTLSPTKPRSPTNPVISPPKFPRSSSTSMLGRSYSPQQALQNSLGSVPNTAFDFTRPEVKRYDNVGSSNGNPFFPYQETRPSNGAMDPMKMTALETQLLDIMRANAVGEIRSPWPSSSMFPSMDNFLDENNHDQIVPSLSSPGQISPRSPTDYLPERYSRKVFVGGLPPDIDEEEITASFRHFGSLVVDWPHKAESKSYFPPKGYAFLLFQDERSVQSLIDACIKDGDKLYLCVSSPTIKNKPVQIRPWNLADSDFVLDGSQPLDPRKTIFVGGVPRPMRAVELAVTMDRLYGGVCYAGIDTDPELKYPKGAGRVAFSNQQSYIAAISARFVQLKQGDIDKRVEVKPYVLDDQMCDECQGTRCGGKFAPFFCANVTCLQYYCEFCWATIHQRPGREFHKPLVKEGGDRPRAGGSFPFRW